MEVLVDITLPKVNSVSFHPARSWILVARSDACTQIWDYSSSSSSDPSLLVTYDETGGDEIIESKKEGAVEEDGGDERVADPAIIEMEETSPRVKNRVHPIRSVDFHPTLPVFCTGGDRCRIHVWNYEEDRCVALLAGHLDYIRTVEFHHHHGGGGLQEGNDPFSSWLISASDDMSVRLWDWVDCSPIAILDSHSGWVMSAKFHPTEDLLVSASLDGTVRVWDCSAIADDYRNRKRQTASGIDASSKVFSSTSVVEKFVLEGHEKGVNWADFRTTPSQGASSGCLSDCLVVSGSDDHSVRVWRLKGNEAFESDKFGMHTDWVCCVAPLLHSNRGCQIISCGFDGTVRALDTANRQALWTYRRKEGCRIWSLKTHYSNGSAPPLVALAHDSGFTVGQIIYDQGSSMDSAGRGCSKPVAAEETVVEKARGEEEEEEQNEHASLVLKVSEKTQTGKRRATGRRINLIMTEELLSQQQKAVSIGSRLPRRSPLSQLFALLLCLGISTGTIFVAVIVLLFMRFG